MRDLFAAVRTSDKALNRAIVGISELGAWRNFDRDIMQSFTNRLVTHKLDLTEKQREVARKRITFVYRPALEILAERKAERVAVVSATVDPVVDTPSEIVEDSVLVTDATTVPRTDDLPF